ncbi:MAG: ParB/Srx family N-terminal domain-containing protein [Saprospiraceae bacterium]
MENQIVFIPIKDLYLDTANPRLPDRLRSDKSVSEGAIIDWMLEDASLLDLVMSISTNGYFPGEPILVVQEHGRNMVVEGNRRLAACKILCAPDADWKRKVAIQGILRESSSQSVPNRLPVLIFATRREILDYLGYRHVTGVQSWSPLAKARYLNELFDIHKRERPADPDATIHRLLTKKIASRVDAVRRSLTTYRLFLIIKESRFFKIQGLDEDTLEFSKLSDAATKYEKIRTFLGVDFDREDPLQNLNYENLAELVHWIFEKNAQNQTRVGDSRNFPILAEIVSHPDAIQSFREGSDLRSASMMTGYPSDQFNQFVTEALVQMKNALGIVSRIEIFDPTSKSNLKEIERAARNLSLIANEAEELAQTESL